MLILGESFSEKFANILELIKSLPVAITTKFLKFVLIYSETASITEIPFSSFKMLNKGKEDCFKECLIDSVICSALLLSEQ